MYHDNLELWKLRRLHILVTILLSLNFILHFMSEFLSDLGVQPVIRDSKDYGAMKRERLLWGNTPGLDSRRHLGPEDMISLQHVLKPYRKANVLILPTIRTTTHSQCTGKVH